MISSHDFSQKLLQIILQFVDYIFMGRISLFTTISIHSNTLEPKNFSPEDKYFNFNIARIKGKLSQVADGLSRQNLNTTRTNEYSKEILSAVTKKSSFIGAMPTLTPGSRLTKSLMKEYQSNPFFKSNFENPENHSKSKTECCFTVRGSVFPMDLSVLNS